MLSAAMAEPCAHAPATRCRPSPAQRFRPGIARAPASARERPLPTVRSGRPRRSASQDHAPRIANTINPTGQQRAADEQPREVRRQHHGKGVGAGAHELHDGLRPDHFVTQCHTACDGIQPQGQAIRRFVVRDAGSAPGPPPGAGVETKGHRRRPAGSAWRRRGHCRARRGWRSTRRQQARCRQSRPRYSLHRSCPPALPKWCGSLANERTSTGSVPPINSAGMPTSAKGNTQASNPMCCSSQAKGLAAMLMAKVAPTPSTATSTSSPAYNNTGCCKRSAQRPNSNPPSASPAKKALMPVVMAYTSTPTTNDSCLIHSTWYTSAAAPETNSSNAGISRAGEVAVCGAGMADDLLATREDIADCLVQNIFRR